MSAEEVTDSGGPRRSLETIDDRTWEAFFAAPQAVLMIATTTCPICRKWTRELSEWLATADAWPAVRFGKLNLDGDGVAAFKAANRDWLADLPGVPYNVVLVEGERRGALPGRGVKRLEQRLERLLGAV